MAFTQRNKRTAAVGAIVGTLTLGGIAYSSSTENAARPGVYSTAQSLSLPAAASPTPTPKTSTSAASTVTVTGKSSATTASTNTVITVSGKVTGAKPGAKVRLQTLNTGADPNSASSWATLAYTSFTGNDGSFSFPVKLETAGSYKLRILHPSDTDGPAQAYSGVFAVTVK